MMLIDAPDQKYFGTSYFFIADKQHTLPMPVSQLMLTTFEIGCFMLQILTNTIENWDRK